MVMNKKGDFTGILILIVSVAAFAFFLIIVAYVVGQINPQIQAQIGISPEINNSLVMSQNVATNTFPTLWMIMFGGLMLGLFITAWFVPSHPIFIPIFAILLVITIVVAIPLSNAYNDFATNPTLSSTASQQGLIGFMMGNLPIVAFVVGIIVLIISFAKPGGYDIVPV